MKNILMLALMIMSGIGCTSLLANHSHRPEQIILGTIPGYIGTCSTATPILGDGFGSAVGLDGNHLVTTAPQAQAGGILNAGAIYFYQKDEYGQFIQSQEPYSQYVTNSLPGVFNSVKIHGDKLMVSIGTTEADEGGGTSTHPGGAVLYFEFVDGKWVYKQTLQPFNLPPGANFGGRAIDFNDEWAFIGAAYTTEGSAPAGHGGIQYIFKRVNGSWIQWQEVLDPNGYPAGSYVEFGHASAISGNFAMICQEGNFIPSDGTITNGNVFVFELQDDGLWHIVQELTGNQPITPPFGDLFGFSIGLNDKWAVISAVFDITNPLGIPAGAVYFFKAEKIEGVTTWVFKQKIYSDMPTFAGAFGTHVVLNDDTAYVGDMRPSPDGVMPHVGAVLGFKLKNGVWETTPFVTYNDPTQQAFDYFGGAFAVSDGVIAIGDIPNSDYYAGGGGRTWPGCDIGTAANNGKVVIFKIKE